MYAFEKENFVERSFQSALDSGRITRSTYPLFLAGDADGFAVCLSLRHLARIKSPRSLVAYLLCVLSHADLTGTLWNYSALPGGTCTNAVGSIQHPSLLSPFHPLSPPFRPLYVNGRFSTLLVFLPSRDVKATMVARADALSLSLSLSLSFSPSRPLSVSVSVSLRVSERKDACVTLRRESA